jgi:hypothetical protein
LPRYLGLSYLAERVGFEKTPLVVLVLIAGAVFTIKLRPLIIEFWISGKTALWIDGLFSVVPKLNCQASSLAKADIVLLSNLPAAALDPAEYIPISEIS